MMNKMIKNAVGAIFIVLAISIYAIGTDSEAPGEFAMDFPKYIDWPVDSILNDIKSTPIDGHVFCRHDSLGKRIYVGYYFVFPDGVGIALSFDSEIPHPDTLSEMITEPKYFGNSLIRRFMMEIDCRERN